MEETAPAFTQEVSFDDLRIAFDGKSDNDIRRAYWLFKTINSNFLVRVGPAVLKAALWLHLPVLGLVKATIFRQFCGGENIEDCAVTIKKLYSSGLGSVLDYSIEGEENEETFDSTCEEICRTIERSSGDRSIPFCVFKMTGVGRFEILRKKSEGELLSDGDQKEFTRIRNRVHRICALAGDKNVRVFIDAEESWIQQAIDDITDEMMQKFNVNGQAVVFNTIQLYRTDRYDFMVRSHQKALQGNYILGVKLVRGAYMEKERDRALKHGYTSPIHTSHQNTNKDYDRALVYCMEHINSIEVCAGTHNENSSLLLTNLMKEKGIEPSDDRIWFSQLLGMSDHISYNLAHSGYNVAKYVPYGPVKAVLPYLIRRAQENTSIAGQMGRELKMIIAEQKRRRKGS
jgi:proline dehydrogenase